ncbi:MAG: NAD-dependent epimerase/dehydratase family protein, partial [Anaerolineae bacterium]
MTGARVLLINPPALPGTTVNREGAAGFGAVYPREGAFLYPPHTLAVCAALLRSDGRIPAVIDAAAEQISPREALERAAEFDPQYLVVQVCWPAWEADLAFCRAARARFPKAPLIVFGTILRHGEFAAQAAACADMVLVGEPERALPAAVERVQRVKEGPAPVITAPELAPQDYDEQGYLHDIESLPPPAWELTPWKRCGFLSVLSSRGCDQSCVYCPYVVGWGRRFRACGPARVREELRWLKERFAPARVMFRDPVFGRDRERAAGICDALQREHLPMLWECESRPEHFDPDLLRLMGRAGCGRVKIGLESVEPARLVRLGRTANTAQAEEYVEQARRAAAGCREAGIRSHVYVMVGWSDAQPGEIERLGAFLRELGADDVSVKPAEVYPLTAWMGSAPVDASAAERQAELLAQMLPPGTEAAPLRPAAGHQHYAEEPGMKALVTGATGFVGMWVARLLLEEGTQVRVLVRPGSDRRNLAGLDVEFVEGDLREPESLAEALAGCDELYHVAALYSTREEDAPLMYEVNVGGTKAILNAARRAGVRRVVHTSTIGTIGRPADGSL